jgi:hypothetical protein
MSELEEFSLEKRLGEWQLHRETVIVEGTLEDAGDHYVIDPDPRNPATLFCVRKQDVVHHNKVRSVQCSDGERQLYRIAIKRGVTVTTRSYVSSDQVGIAASKDKTGINPRAGVSSARKVTAPFFRAPQTRAFSAYRSSYQFVEHGSDLGALFASALRHPSGPANYPDLRAINIIPNEGSYTRPGYYVAYTQGHTPVYHGIRDNFGREGGQGPVFECDGGYISVDVYVEALSSFDMSVIPSCHWLIDIDFVYNVFGEVPANRLVYPGGTGAGCHMVELWPQSAVIKNDNASGIGNQWSYRSLRFSTPTFTGPIQNPWKFPLEARCFGGRFIQFIRFSYNLRQV